MNSRGHVRRSLCPTFKAKNGLNSPDKNSKLSDISDATDAEWENIQSKINVSNSIFNVEEQNYGDEFVDPLYDLENMPNRANLDAQIEAKQKELDRVQQIALDLQDRFVWDLSLAIKKDLFRKHYNDHKKREEIANVGISGIVERNQNDPKNPEEWKEWITEQYPYSH